MAETAIVTGGAGFIGSHVVDALLEDGISVVVVDDLTSGERARVNPEAEFVELSIVEKPELDSVFDRVPTIRRLPPRGAVERDGVDEGPQP